MSNTKLFLTVCACLPVTSAYPNPWLKDLDHIEAGQKIRVPSTSSVSQTILPIVRQVPAATSAGAEKP